MVDVIVLLKCPKLLCGFGRKTPEIVALNISFFGQYVGRGERTITGPTY